jgi:hypothetical protein
VNAATSKQTLFSREKRKLGAKLYRSSSLILLTVQMTLRESYLAGNATQGIQAETLTKIGTPDRRSSLTWIPLLKMTSSSNTYACL